MTFDGLLALRPFVFVSISQANLLSNHLEEQLEARLETRQDRDRAEWAGKGSELHMLGSVVANYCIYFFWFLPCRVGCPWEGEEQTG